MKSLRSTLPIITSFKLLITVDYLSGYFTEEIFEMLRKEYNEKLESEFESKQLAESTGGKPVIPTGHSRLLNGKGYSISIRTFGYFYNLSHERLLRVPWLQLEDACRGIPSESPQLPHGIQHQYVQKQLRIHGYR